MDYYLLVIVGFVLLLSGAEVMLRGAVGIAEKLGISKLVVGMTVVAFGTSAPEFLVSLNAALSGSSGLAIGNLVGSNIANILLVTGVSGLLMPIIIDGGVFKRDGWVLLAGTSLFMILAFRREFDFIAGSVLLVFFLGFLFNSYLREKDNFADQVEIYGTDLKHHPHKILRLFVFLIIGFAGIIYGADILVEGGIGIARRFGISEAVIGLTIMAFGTSLPELAATIVSVIRKHADIAFGNIVGSNIFNIIGIIGVISLVTPLNVPTRLANFDMWVMLVATLILIPYMIGKKTQLNRLQASLMLSAYLVYIFSIHTGIDKLVHA